MQTITKLTIAQILMYVRDRQSVFFAFFFPLFFMLALGYMVGGGEIDPVDLSVVADDPNASAVFINALEENDLTVIHEEGEAAARESLRQGDRDAIVFAPRGTTTGNIPVRVLVNQSDPQRTATALTVLRAVLVDVEHAVRGTEPLFALQIEDVEARTLRYVDFLIPGLLAFMVMQLAIAGSGFNIVEYKRKGILKRLFVTPLRPLTFIVSLIAARLIVILAQISVLLLVAKLVFDIAIVGNIFMLYLFVILGSVLFLGLGFALGGIAKTQNAVMAIGNLFIFPQMFLAGIFFPLDSLPAWVQPIAALLPLNFVSDALRQVANEGAGFSSLGTDLLGIAVWTVVGLALAVWLFKWGEGADA